VFTEVSGETQPETSIKRFGEFQQNLLRHYAYYCELLRKTPETTAVSMKR